MNILTAENISKFYTEKTLLDKVSFSLQEGEKVGVIGINGTGKSTLLKILSGLEEPDEGKVVTANHVIVRYLPQDPQFSDKETVLQGVLRGNVTKANQWNIESQAKSMLTKLGVTEFDKECAALSGGEKKRLALVSVLLSEADILVLDEPTNHLDNSMADWLEEILKNWKGAFVMVTHDRYFLDAVTNRIVEIQKGKLYSYQANYSGYLELKMQREDMEQASERKRQSILRNELAWVMRGARARSTKQKARLERYEELKSQAGPSSEEAVELSSVQSRLGRTTIELEHISKSYGDRTLIRDFSYIFLKNDRVGFVGKNGCGKSTLMKILCGEIQPDGGSITVGQTVKIGYYAQEVHKEMDPAQRVIDYVKDIAEFLPTRDGLVSASKMLERFLFTGEMQYSLLGKLSGGEKRRLNLLRVLMGAPNVLILDEPTNDLDITTLTILEDYLDHFPGIVIAVSHDRYFLDRTIRRIFAFEEDGVLRQYEGGYTDYSQKKAQEEAPVQETKAQETRLQNKFGEDGELTLAQRKGRVPKLKFTYQEQRDYETIEEDISRLEDKVQELEEKILASARDFVKLNEFTKEKEEAEQLLEEKMERWMYLEDLAKRIERGENQ